MVLQRKMLRFFLLYVLRIVRPLKCTVFKDSYTVPTNPTLHCNKRLVTGDGKIGNLFYSVQYCLNLPFSAFLSLQLSHLFSAFLSLPFKLSHLQADSFPIPASYTTTYLLWIFSAPIFLGLYVYTYILIDAGLRAYISPRQRRETARPILRIPPGSGTTIKGTVRREKQFVPNCSEGFALLDRKAVITSTERF